MRSCVLDASAVLAFLLNEPGGREVGQYLATAQWSAVNYSEVLTRLGELTGSLEDTRSRINQLELELVPLDVEQATVTASLRPATKQYGLSLADRACLALAITCRAPVVTADQSWRKLDLGIEIIQIRQAA